MALLRFFAWYSLALFYIDINAAAERSVMARIYVFGHVTEDIIPRQSQTDSTYVCFTLRERTGKDHVQYYQVWAWSENAQRLIRQKVHKNSVIWLTGTLELVDSTVNRGNQKTKLLKVYLSNWGFVPYVTGKTDTNSISKETELPLPIPASAEVLDGDREALPE